MKRTTAQVLQEEITKAEAEVQAAQANYVEAKAAQADSARLVESTQQALVEASARLDRVTAAYHVFMGDDGLEGIVVRDPGPAKLRAEGHPVSAVVVETPDFIAETDG